jgi:hypothetical protein
VDAVIVLPTYQNNTPDLVTGLPDTYNLNLSSNRKRKSSRLSSMAPRTSTLSGTVLTTLFRVTLEATSWLVQVAEMSSTA